MWFEFNCSCISLDHSHFFFFFLKNVYLFTWLCQVLVAHNTREILYCQDMDKKTFGENLKKERKIAGLTQQQLAEKLGIKQQQLSEWECNKVEPTVFNIVAIVKALGISYDELFEDLW